MECINLSGKYKRLFVYPELCHHDKLKKKEHVLNCHRFTDNSLNYPFNLWICGNYLSIKGLETCYSYTLWLKFEFVAKKRISNKDYSWKD